MSIGFSTNVLNIDGNSIPYGQTQVYSGSATFTLADSVTSFNIINASLQGPDVSPFTLFFSTPVTIDNTLGNVTTIEFQVQFTNNNPSTQSYPISAVFETGNFQVSASPGTPAISSNIQNLNPIFTNADTTGIWSYVQGKTLASLKDSIRAGTGSGPFHGWDFGDPPNASHSHEIRFFIDGGITPYARILFDEVTETFQYWTGGSGNADGFVVPSEPPTPPGGFIFAFARSGTPLTNPPLNFDWIVQEATPGGTFPYTGDTIFSSTSFTLDSEGIPPTPPKFTVRGGASIKIDPSAHIRVYSD